MNTPGNGPVQSSKIDSVRHQQDDISRPGWRDVRQVGKGGTFLLVLLALVASFAGWRVFEELTRHRSILAGPPSPWATQLAVANEAVSRLDKESILSEVMASPILEGRTTLSTTLRVQFGYITSSGGLVRVIVEDSHPAAFVETINTGSAPVDGTELEKLRAAAQAIKISPRDAVEATIPELEAATGQDAEAGIGLTGLYVSLVRQGEYRGTDWPAGSRAIWHVMYIGKGARFMVDVETAQVLRKEFDTSDTMSVPTPAPDIP